MLCSNFFLSYLDIDVVLQNKTLSDFQMCSCVYMLKLKCRFATLKCFPPSQHVLRQIKGSYFYVDYTEKCNCDFDLFVNHIAHNLRTILLMNVHLFTIFIFIYITYHYTLQLKKSYSCNK